MTILAIFLFLAFAFGGVELVEMTFAEYSVQDQAQTIAVSEGHYGGCTTSEENLVQDYINDFCQNQNVSASQAKAIDKTGGSEPYEYGTNVTVSLSLPYELQVLGGSIPVTLTGMGRSVSSYIQGMTPDVSYASLSP